MGRVGPPQSAGAGGGRGWPSALESGFVRSTSRATRPIERSPRWHSSTISALNSGVNDRRGRGLLGSMLSMTDILPGAPPLMLVSVKPGQAHCHWRRHSVGIRCTRSACPACRRNRRTQAGSQVRQSAQRWPRLAATSAPLAECLGGVGTATERELTSGPTPAGELEIECVVAPPKP